MLPRGREKLDDDDVQGVHIGHLRSCEMFKTTVSVLNFKETAGVRNGGNGPVEN